MTKLPGFMFYPGDWVKDPDLSRCTKAAKGMWMDMLCKAFECEERGVFITAGRPWLKNEIAGAVGGDVAANSQMLDELLDRGVAKIDKRGAIFCARMIRDEAIRKLRSEAGQLGGRPTKYSEHNGVTSKSKTKANIKANSKQNTEYENERVLKKGGAGGEIPAGLSTEAFKKKWEAWVQCRRKMKKPADWGILFREQLAWLSIFEAAVAVDILSTSIRNGWQGLFEPKATQGNLQIVSTSKLLQECYCCKKPWVDDLHGGKKPDCQCAFPSQAKYKNKTFWCNDCKKCKECCECPTT